MAALVRNTTPGGANATPGVVYTYVQWHATSRLKRFRFKRPICPRPTYVLGATWFFSRCSNYVLGGYLALGRLPSIGHHHYTIVEL
jgi:hypothetical protein